MNEDLKLGLKLTGLVFMITILVFILGIILEDLNQESLYESLLEEGYSVELDKSLGLYRKCMINVEIKGKEGIVRCDSLDSLEKIKYGVKNEETKEIPK